MISAGIKKEEYREIKKYWLNRLFEPLAKDYKHLPGFAVGPSLESTQYSTEARQFDVTRFRNGYEINHPLMLFEYKGIGVGTGWKE